MQRTLITIGIAVLVTGLLWPWLARLGLGRLPGDLRIQTGNSVFYFPLATCLLVSIVLSLVLWLLRRRSRRQENFPTFLGSAEPRRGRR